MCMLLCSYMGKLKKSKSSDFIGFDFFDYDIIPFMIIEVNICDYKILHFVIIEVTFIP